MIKKADYVNSIDIANVDWLKQNCDSLTVQEMSGVLKEILLNPAINVFPKSRRKYVKKSNNTSESWFDRSCWMKRQDYHRAKHKHNKSKSESSHKFMVDKSRVYKQELKKAQKRGRKRFIRKLRELKVRNPKLYWRLIGDCKREAIPILISDLFTHFKELSVDAQEAESEFPSIIGPSLDDSELNRDFTEEEICYCIYYLKKGKAAGVDLFLNEYIKCTKDIMLPLSVKLFNKVLQSGQIPED